MVASIPSPALDLAARTALDESVFSLKKEALEKARATAIADGRQPTLGDYYDTAMALAQERNVALTGGMAVDLHGQRIEGYLFAEQKDHPIAAYYGKLSLRGASVDCAAFHPATAFNKELAEAASITNCTFDGLSGDDVFSLGNGNKSSIELANNRITNSNGGTFIVDGATLDTMMIDGNRITKFVMQHGARIKDVTANAGIVEINAQPGSIIEGCTFHNTSFSLAGNMRDITSINNDFSNTNMSVDMSGSTIIGGILPPEKGLQGLVLNGATLQDVKLADGSYVQSAEQLRTLGVAIDSTTTVAVSPEHRTAMATVAPPHPALAGFDLSGLSSISGLTNASLAEPVAPSNEVAAMEKPAPAAGKEDDGISMNMLLAMKAAQSSSGNG